MLKMKILNTKPMKKKLFFSFGILAGTVSFMNAQNVYIPDANFKAYLVSSPGINTNGDSEISVSEAEAFTGGLACYNKNIANLTGVEAFVNVTMILCYRNQLTSIDISKNTALKQLVCDQNQLTSLDVSKNTALESLSFAINKLTNIDIIKNTNLITLDCQANLLTSLDTSKNILLQTIYSHYNKLTSLDLSKNTVLKNLWCFNNQLTTLNVKIGNNALLTTMTAQNNPNLTCIQVDNITNANSYSGWNKDATANYTIDLETCRLSVDTSEKVELSFFPNPVKDILTIKTNEKLIETKIYNIQGNLINHSPTPNKTLNLNHLKKGIYIIEVKTDKGSKSLKFIKD